MYILDVVLGFTELQATDTVEDVQVHINTLVKENKE